jgi:hypothetical protein
MLADHACNAHCSGGEHCDLVYVGAAGEPDWSPTEALARCDWAVQEAAAGFGSALPRIVLAVAAGAGTSEAARLVGVSRPTVIKWRDRFAARGLSGLEDEARSGRPKTVDDAAIIAATLEPPPARLG